MIAGTTLSHEIATDRDSLRPSAAAPESQIAAAYARRSAAIPSDRYSHFDAANLQRVQQYEREVLKLLATHGFRRLEKFEVLEVGCGTGSWLRELIQWGARPEKLTGIDLLPDRIATGKSLTASPVRLVCGSAATLDFPSEHFDIVLQSTMFTSILDADLKRQVAAEMTRVVNREGLILWYDFSFDNPANPDVRGVTRAEIHRLFPACRIELKRITLAPPLARRLAPFSRWLCEFLQLCPFLCTHYLGAIRRA